MPANYSHCVCLLLSLCSLLILGAITYDCLDDAKISYININDSLDWECGSQYIRLDKDWDGDGDGHNYNHTSIIIRAIIKYVHSLHNSDDIDTSYNLNYETNTQCEKFGDYIYYNLTKYLIIDNTTNSYNSISLSDYSTEYMCQNTYVSGIMWLIWASISFVASAIAICSLLYGFCRKPTKISFWLMRINAISSLLCNILSWSIWLMKSDFCNNVDYWKDHLCDDNDNDYTIDYQCTFSYNIGGSIVIMLIVLGLQIITIIIMFMKIKRPIPHFRSYRQFSSESSDGGPYEYETTTKITSSASDSFDDTGYKAKHAGDNIQLSKLDENKQTIDFNTIQEEQEQYDSLS